jgi:RHS repeat-associated protein
MNRKWQLLALVVLCVASLRASFAQPNITGLSPASGTVGTSVAITGTNFGSTQGSSTVTFNGTTATTIANWSATSITATVPTGATTGNVVVTVGGVASNGVWFTFNDTYGNGYQYRQTIVLGHANVPNTDQTNFPVLISGVYSYLANVSNGGLVQSANGYDIVFCSDPEGANPLNYETDTYDPATGTVNFWVSIPTLSHTADTIIYLFYGNSSITSDQSNKTAVWDANYVGVWHLPNGTTLTANDSTSNGRNGTLSGVTATAGQVDGGASFNGSSVITIPTIGSLTGPFTIEEWASPGSTSGTLGLFGSRSPSDESFDAKLTSGLIHADIGSGSGWLNTSADASFSYSVNSWHDFVYAVSDTGYQIFADGASIGSGSFSGTPLLFDSNHILEIGGTGYGGEEFVGAIDEVRVSSTIRSADWIATEYANESSPSTFYTVEGQATPNSAPTVQFLSPATGLVGSSVTIQGYGFQSAQGASTVTFNGVTASPTSWNDASIIVPVPAGATNGNVIVTVGGVASNGVSFTVLPTAAIINLSPASGPVGTTVTITGTNFGATQGASTVTFAGTTATPTNWNATSITVPVPSGATTGNVFVTVDRGASNGIGFTVTPSLSVTGLSPSSGMVGTLVTITGTLFGATQGASTVALNTVNATVASWSDTTIVAFVPAGAASGPFSVTVNGQAATSPSFIVTAIPTGWVDADVGTVSQPGSATYSGSTFTVAGAGGGTWGNADGMNFAYQTMVGDGSITARLTSLQSYGPSAYAEAGVMIRETLNPGSTNALILYSNGVPCPGSRSTTDAGENVSTGLASGSMPQWMQLVRAGNALTAYISSDGVNWTQLGATMTVAMAQTVYIGMFVSGINYLEPATFDNVSINSTANPAPVITALSPSSASIGSQIVIIGNNFGATQGGSVLLLNGAPITITAWSNTGIAFTVPTGATSGLLAVSVAPGMNESNPVNLEVTTQPLPTSWLNQDVTAVDTPIGSATFSGGIFKVTGAGGGFGGTADGMQFVYETLVGDGSIIARLTSLQNTPYSGTDAGVMIRETLDPGATDATVFYAGSSGYLYFQDRPTTGATVSTAQGSYVNAFPEWLELVRAGNTFTGFSSPDGVNWTQIGTSTTVTMAQTVYIGLAVSGFGTLEPATFDNVSINSTANPAPVITGLSATSASVGSQVGITGNNFGATQNGSVLLLNGTSITINLWSNTSIVFTVPVGATSGPLVVSVAPSMNDSNPVNLGISADPPPTPWLNQDVGAVGTQTGSSTFAGGTFTVTGAGGGPGGTADGMQFAYQTLVGDGSIVARLTSLQNTPYSGTDAGVMIRETLNSGATDATVFYSGGSGYLYFQDRPTTGATASTAQGSYVNAFPEWLELVRAGNTFTGFSSPDGVNWTQIGTSTTVTMAQTVYIGLAVSGFGTLEPATFDNVAVTIGTTPFVTGVTPIVGNIGTSVTIAGSNFGTTQGTSTVTFNGALATTITSWSNSQIVATVPNAVPNGTGPVIVTVNSIASPITTSALFTVINPIIASLEPPAGPVGGILTINGSGFGASQNGVVLINGVNAGITYNCPAGVLEPCWSDTQIQVGIPNTTSGLVTVSNDGIVSNSVPFTVSPPPTITSLSPTTGEPATVITIGGSGFGASQSNSTVAVGGINAPVNSWSDSQIIAAVPNIPMNGIVTVTVGGTTAPGPLFIYNAINQLTASNGAVTTYNSGDFGNAWLLYSSAGPGCSTCSVRGNVLNSYDNNGNLLSTTDANGNVVTYTYDGNNNMLSKTAQLNGSPVTTSYTYNNLAEVLTMTDPLGNTTTNTYDAHGNLLTVASPNPNSQTPPSVTQFTYNTLGELTQILDPLNHPTTITYYSTGLIQSITDAQNHTTSYAYDSRGNRTSVIDPINGSAHPTSFAYDAMSRLTGITYPDGTTASFAYDSRGRRISATDQNGKTTTYAYDGADRLISVTDAASNLTQYNYDTEDNLISITDANNHTTYFTYDTLGRVTQTTFPSTLTETYTYDQLYNLTSKTDRKGQTIQYVYDSLYRMTSKTYPDETSASYVYDLAGKIQQVTDPTGTYAFAYDNMGRLVGTSTQYTFLPGYNFQNSYRYDAASNRTSLTAPDGSTNSYNYDTLNRLTTLTNSLTGQFSFGYDAMNRRTQLTRPNGVNTNYNYDSVSHLLSVLHQAGSTTLDGASYGYDYAGNRTSKTNYLNGITSNYGYDAIYELLQVTQGGSTTESYSYDAVGNRLSSSAVPSYSYNSSNELTSNSSGSYTYDANGNTLSDPSGKSYSWDFENRLIQAVVPGTNGGTTTFKYDPFGRRIQKSGPLGTTNYLYDGMDLQADDIQEVDNGGNILARYIEANYMDQPLAEVRGATTSYYDGDALGSVTSLSNSTGVLANLYTYDTLGNITTSTGTLTNPFHFTGRDADSESNLYYYRTRYYDPTVGRFLSEDFARFGAGQDFYAYVGNNPARFKDPSGLIGIDGSCSCPDNKNAIQAATPLAIAGAAGISDPKLRDCVLNHLNNGTVKCGGSRCDKGSKPDKNEDIVAGWALPWGNTIHLCQGAYGSPTRVACIMIHEIAHTCGHPGEGVPDKAMNQAFPGQCPQ